MNFDKHLFVSYAHVDDLPTPGDDQGWVTRFHKYLETYLSQSIGEQARVWRDDRLRGNDIFANEIVKQFPNTAILLSILFAPVHRVRMVPQGGHRVLQDGGVAWWLDDRR